MERQQRRTYHCTRTRGLGSRKMTTVTHDLGNLRGQQRAVLVARMHEIYETSCSGLTRAQFEIQHFSNPEARARTFTDVSGRMVGFAIMAIQRVATGGRTHGVFSLSVFFRPGIRGGVRIGLFVLTEALQRMMREPRMPLACLTRTNSPAGYRSAAAFAGVMYPHPHFTAPAQVTRLVEKLVILRGLQPVGGSPWLVRTTANPHEPERIRASAKVRSDPFADFYTTQNPRWAEGISMLVWIDLSPWSLALGLCRVAPHLLSRR